MSAAHIVCPACRAVNRIAAGRVAAEAKCGACGVAIFSGQPVAVDEAALARHVARDDIAVLVDVWAEWCAPCRAMAPDFARAAALLEPDMRLLKLDADAAPAFCARHGVSSIPTLLLFRDGDVVARVSGAMSASRIAHWARSSLPG